MRPGAKMLISQSLQGGTQGNRAEGAERYRSEAMGYNRMGGDMQGAYTYRQATSRGESPSSRESRMGSSMGANPGMNAEMYGGMYGGGESPEMRFRDRRGRQHYDNGRYAPKNNEMEQEMMQGRMEDRMENRMGEEDMPEMAAPRPSLYALPPQGAPNSVHQLREYENHQIGFTGGGEQQEKELTRAMAKEWATGMKNADGSTGAHWAIAQTDNLMRQVEAECEPHVFWVIINSLYSDYCAILKKYGANRPEIYAELAKAWLEDEDAVEEKAAMYYKCIVKH